MAMRDATYVAISWSNANLAAVPSSSRQPGGPTTRDRRKYRADLDEVIKRN